MNNFEFDFRKFKFGAEVLSMKLTGYMKDFFVHSSVIREIILNINRHLEFGRIASINDKHLKAYLP